MLGVHEAYKQKYAKTSPKHKFLCDIFFMYHFAGAVLKNNFYISSEVHFLVLYLEKMGFKLTTYNFYRQVSTSNGSHCM